jgi:hypothetical protein
MTRDTDSYRPTRNSTPWFVGIIIALALLAIAYLVFSASTSPSARSGPDMLVLTDTETGCQYLYKSGGITPRVAADGKHICTQIEETGL